MDSAEVSRRLKAARWLAGGTKANGKPKELSVERLATHPLLVANRITKNRLAEFEQMITTPRLLELKVIGEAFGLPDWFDGDHAVIPADAAAVLRQLTLGAVDQVRRRTEGEAPSESDGTDPPAQAPGGGGS